MRAYAATLPAPEFSTLAWVTPPPLAAATVAIVTSAALFTPDDSRLAAGDTGYRFIDGVRRAERRPALLVHPAVSFVVNCDTQDEVDYYWDRLVEGGAPSQCGWLTDRFGLSRQIVPRCLPDYLMGADAVGAQRAMEAMMGMVKLSIPDLDAAYHNSTSINDRT